MFVHDALRGSLQRGCERSSRLSDVVVDELLKPGGLMARRHRSQHEEQPRLPFGQSLEERQQHRAVDLLLPLNNRGGMTAGRQQITAVGWAVDFDDAFGAAAHRADLLPERRARAFGFSLVANGTHHLWQTDLSVQTELSSINDPVTQCL